MARLELRCCAPMAWSHGQGGRRESKQLKVKSSCRKLRFSLASRSLLTLASLASESKGASRLPAG